MAEEQLMDVAILGFKSEELTEKEAEGEGTNPEIRKAEGNFIAYHLKNTLQQSTTGSWIEISIGNIHQKLIGNQPC